MAKTIVAYSAVLTNTDYIFDRPDLSGEKTAYDYGTELRLPADYAARESNGFYPVTYPESGWVRYYMVGSISPVYETTPDKCKAPTSVTVNATAKTLTISGGAGGDLNTFTGYGISWRDAKIGSNNYGAWSSDVVVTSTSNKVTYNITAPNGYVRQFRVRTLGSAGAAYYSDYVTGTTLVGNTPPKTPQIKLPAANAVTIHHSPYIVLEFEADADGDTMTVKRKVDNGEWVNVGTTNGGIFTDRPPKLKTGRRVVSYKLDDGKAESEAVSIEFVVSSHVWGRKISTGDVIANATISHRGEISDMLTAVNEQRLFYGLGVITLPGVVGRFGSWGEQMAALLDGVNECRRVSNIASIALTIPQYPTASVINTIRSMTTGEIDGMSGDVSAALDFAELDKMILS